jgi:hypothetical protein
MGTMGTMGTIPEPNITSVRFRTVFRHSISVLPCVPALGPIVPEVRPSVVPSAWTGARSLGMRETPPARHTRSRSPNLLEGSAMAKGDDPNHSSRHWAACRRTLASRTEQTARCRGELCDVVDPIAPSHKDGALTQHERSASQGKHQDRRACTRQRLAVRQPVTGCTHSSGSCPGAAKAWPWAGGCAALCIRYVRLVSSGPWTIFAAAARQRFRTRRDEHRGLNARATLGARLPGRIATAARMCAHDDYTIPRRH